MYDGTELINHEYFIDKGEGLYDLLPGHTLDIINNTSITNVVYDYLGNVCGIANEIETIKVMNGLMPVTNNYEIFYTPGILTINPRIFVVETFDYTKEFDGVSFFELDEQLFIIHQSDGFATGEYVSNVLYGNYDVFVGIHPMDIIFTIINSEDVDVTNNYKFEITYGDLEITGEEFDQGSMPGGEDGVPGVGDYTMPSGMLSTGGGSPQNIPLFNINSSETGVVYLRGMSYGNYNSFGFVNINGSIYPINPLTYGSNAYGLENSQTIKIDMATLGIYNSYLLPYFATGNYNIYNDVYVNADYRNAYTVEYVNPLVDFTNYPKLTGQLSEQELIYRQYVYSTYTSMAGVSSELADLLNSIISENGFSKDNLTVISDVQQYIQNCAVYNFNYSVPDNADIVYYFLSEGKEGVCQHFAASATLIYRALGIPARYTTGYKVNTIANTDITVMDKDGHAWVEVYLDGFGWCPVEVTGFMQGPVGDPTLGGETGEVGVPSEGEIKSDEALFKVTTNYNGKILLKEMTYGDFNFDKFEKISYPYYNLYYNPVEYPSNVLSGSSEYYISIDMTSGAYEQYLMPYFVTGSYKDFDEVNFTTDFSNVYNIDFIFAEINYSDYKQVTGELAQHEQKYREYVYKNYLGYNISSKLEDLLNDMINQNGFSNDDPEIVTKVQNYIMSIASYNQSYNYGNTDDPIYSFLAESKIGSSEQFATAATLMYRILGIPARYTVGYQVGAVSGIEMEVSELNEYAWVEVYLDGFGWCPVDVTGDESTEEIRINVKYNTQIQMYTGSEFIFDDQDYIYSYTINDMEYSLPKGYTVRVQLRNDFVFGVDVGVYNINPEDYEAVVINENGETDEYYTSLIVKNQSVYEIVEVNKIIILIEDKVFEYDGNYHSNNEYQLIGELREGHAISVTFPTNLRYPCDPMNNRYIYSIVNEEGIDVTHLYDVDARKATIQIIPRSLEIYFDSIIHPYDSTFPIITVDDISSNDKLLDGHTIDSFTMTDPYADCVYDQYGNIRNYFVYIDSIVILDANRKDISEYYTVNVSKELPFNKCYVELANIDILVKPKDLSKLFDGEELSDPSIEDVNKVMPRDFTITGEVSGSILYPGSVVSRIIEGSIVIENKSGKDVTSYFNIEYAEGVLEVIKPTIELTSGYEGTYDGISHKPELKFLGGAVPSSCTYDVTIDGERLDAGTNDSIITSFNITHPDLGDVTKYFDIITFDGKVIIDKYQVTIKPKDASKTYDGTPLTCNEVEYVTEMLNGYYITISTSGSIISGTTNNYISDYVVMNPNGEDVTDNFAVTTETGILDVTLIKITVYPRNITYTYNGTLRNVKTKIMYSCESDLNITVTADYTGSGLDVGTSDIVITEGSVVIKDSSGNDITSGFDITLEKGTLTINKKSLTIKPVDVLGYYNGSAYKPSHYELVSTSLCSGHSIEYVEYVGELTERGTIASSISYILIVDENGKDVTNNYDIKYLTGVITIE